LTNSLTCGGNIGIAHLKVEADVLNLTVSEAETNVIAHGELGLDITTNRISLILH
jgi:anti-sigma regulatory factor (Ser/Thr protein kinase)